jgi:hypothetical protein
MRLLEHLEFHREDAAFVALAEKLKTHPDEAVRERAAAVAALKK